MSIRKYRIRPKWKNIGKAAGLILGVPLVPYAVGFAIIELFGLIPPLDWYVWGYDVGYWGLGFDLIVFGLMLFIAIPPIFWGLAHTLFEIEQREQS